MKENKKSVEGNISCLDRMPPDDYEYKCMLIMPNGKKTISTGGEIYDYCLPDPSLIKWSEIKI